MWSFPAQRILLTFRTILISFDFSLTDEDMAEISKVDKEVRYYTATPEMIAAYAAMELKEDL